MYVSNVYLFLLLLLDKLKSVDNQIKPFKINNIQKV